MQTLFRNGTAESSVLPYFNAVTQLRSRLCDGPRTRFKEEAGMMYLDVLLLKKAVVLKSSCVLQVHDDISILVVWLPS